MNLILFIFITILSLMGLSISHTYLGKYNKRLFAFPYIAVRRYDFDEELFKTSLLITVTYIALVCTYKLVSDTLLVDHYKFVVSVWILICISILISRYVWVPLDAFKDLDPFNLKTNKVVLSVILNNTSTYQKQFIDRRGVVPKVYYKTYPDLIIEGITLLDLSSGTISIYYNEPQEELPKWVELWKQPS